MADCTNGQFEFKGTTVFGLSLLKEKSADHLIYLSK